MKMVFVFVNSRWAGNIKEKPNEHTIISETTTTTTTTGHMNEQKLNVNYQWNDRKSFNKFDCMEVYV